ncbi:hypothetical protein B0H14DRAFT_2854904, partial [Mycena olivaceomarginata]
MAIPALPTDIFLIVLKYIGVKDLMRLRQTCKDFLQITQLRSVWHELLQTEVIQRNIPIPRLAGRSLAVLTSRELESCLADALRLRRNWISPSPVPMHSFTFKIVDTPAVPARDHRWLISLALTTGGDRIFILQCWDIMLDSPTCIARRTLSDFRGFRINTEPSHPAVMALRSSNGIEILGIDFSAGNPDSGFVTLQTLDNVDESLHVFSGSALLTKFGDMRLLLKTIENPDFSVELQNPSHNEQKECIDGILYSLSSFRAESGARVIHPITRTTWPMACGQRCLWRISLLGLSEPPINILVRYASLFPWALREDCSWVRIAIQEEEGKIA